MGKLATMWRLRRILADYRRRAEVVRTLPIRLWVESSSVCNLRCPMCPNKEMAPGDKCLMPLELFRKVVDEAKGFANDLYLHHRGEPFTNPALFDMIALARAAGLRTRFHTNGALLDEAKALRLLEAGPSLVSFSVDGFAKGPYEQVRVGATFEVTVENILRLARLRRERRQRQPYLIVERIRFKVPPAAETAEGVAALTRRFLEAGVDEVIAKDEYVWAEEGAPEPEAPRVCSACTFPWYAMVICAHGDVAPCPQDFWVKMRMGNVREQSLAEIWNGEPYRALRRAFRTDVEQLPLCRKCDRLRRRTVGGVPLQYLATFLVDHLVGYNRTLRRLVGSSERG